MNSLILRTTARFLLSLLLLFSVFLLFRGHNQPGGGFVGGLVAAGAFILWIFAYGVEETQHLLTVRPQTLIALGLLCAAGSECTAMILGKPFMTGIWTEISLPGLATIPIGTPVFFDIGVYLVVLGVTLTIVMALYHLEEPREIHR